MSLIDYSGLQSTINSIQLSIDSQSIEQSNQKLEIVSIQTSISDLSQTVSNLTNTVNSIQQSLIQAGSLLTLVQNEVINLENSFANTVVSTGNTTSNTPNTGLQSLDFSNSKWISSYISSLKTQILDGNAPFKTWTNAIKTTPKSTIGNTYYVTKNGNDSNNGLSSNTAFATFKTACSMVKPGDTVLIGKGKYSEPINLASGSVSGVAGKPITFGCLGDGEVIIDGTPTLGVWTNVSGGIWSTSLTSKPEAVVVNDVALHPSASSTVTSNSNQWYYSSSKLTVDFGSVNPNSADIVIVSLSNITPIYWYGANYLIFDGITVRASKESGIWGYGSFVTVQNCNCEYNYKNGILFEPGVGNNEGNMALYNRVYQNSMMNWPRGNNNFAVDGGGWAGGISFSGTLNSVARGNISYLNGGEGIISYGSGGTPTGNTLFEQNASIDNWSMNMYFDNQPNDVGRYNILIHDGVDTSTWLNPPSVGGVWADLYKYYIGFALADEYNSSANGSANLANVQYYGNIIAGSRLGIQDYSEGSLTIPHGLKNDQVYNNTIISPTEIYPNVTYYSGLFLRDCLTNNNSSSIKNNLVISNGSLGEVPNFWWCIDASVVGITIDNNKYWNPDSSSNSFEQGYNTPVNENFATWKSNLKVDLNSVFATPVGDGSFNNNWGNSLPTYGSPLINIH